jgi:hypothetical protein
MKNLLAVALLGAAWPVCGQDAAQNWKETTSAAFKIHYTVDDESLASSLVANMEEGTKTVELFFQKRFSKPFDVFVFPSRSALDKQWQTDWGAPEFKSECWMVASGVGHRFDLLSPLVWEQEACEHNARNQEETQKLFTHELVHVFHGQQNPVPDFTGLDDLAWLIEGVAVYASGQLDETRMASLRKLVSENKHPKKLNAFWSGKDKYGLAGSLVQFIDRKVGRAKLLSFLKETKQETILAQLGLTEDQLIEAWQKSL